MIYISYSHLDEFMAKALYAALVRQGYKVWMDIESLRVGSLFAQAVEDIIRKCDVFLVLITNNSLNSSWVIKEVSLCLEVARQRDKVIIPAVFDRTSLCANDEWMFYLSGYQWLLCDNKDIDWIKAISDMVARTYGNEQRKNRKYEEFSELRKSGNVLYASEKLTELMGLILTELEDCLPSKRKQLLIELDRCLKQIEALYDYDYSTEASRVAHLKLDVLRRIASLPELSRKDPEDIFSLACAIHFLHWDREIRWQCADAITHGDVSEGIVKTLPESDFAEKQEPYKELLCKHLDSGNWENGFTEAETEFILASGEYLYEASGFPRKEEIKRHQQETPDEKMEMIARYIQDGNRIFELIGQDEKAIDFLRCLITSYERLKSYCDVVGARKISAECVERIADLKQRFLQQREEEEAPVTKAEKGIKALLGLTLPSSGKYDVFLSHKTKDEDIAGYVYGFLKSHLKEVFFDKISLPEISKSEYRKAIMTALDHSKHFIVIVTSIEVLQETDSSDWVQREMETFHTEIFEGRKKDSNFIILATDEVYDQVMSNNKSNIYIDWRNYTILKISEYRETLMHYLK